MKPEKLHVVVLEPYHGGSHAAFVSAIQAHSRHRITLVTLPARKWKWRMRGAAIWFAREQNQWLSGGGAVDVVLCNDMLSVADLRALLPSAHRNLPIACYFHENQLTYPIPDEQDRDFQYGMTNITSCLAADAVWFNTAFHRDDFLAAAGKLLHKMPDFVPRDIIAEIRNKTAVLPPPVTTPAQPRPRDKSRPPTILWCHRWEYDKNPEPFFDALLRLDDAGCAFRLVLLGEQFREVPAVFADSWRRLSPHVHHAGYLPDRAEYFAMLAECDLVVSTAIQENFGIAIVEAILAGCQPLVPDRLAYPEVLPEGVHGRCLFADDANLFPRLHDLVLGRGWLTEDEASHLRSDIAARFAAENAVGRLDDALSHLRSLSETASVP